MLRGQEGKRSCTEVAPKDVQGELGNYIIPGVKAFQGAESQRLTKASGSEK